MKFNRWCLVYNDGKLVFPRLYWFIKRLKASWVNKKWVTKEMMDEILRGN